MGSSGSMSEHGRVAVGRGQRSELTSETGTLLRARLRAVALLLFVSFSIFLIGHITVFNTQNASSLFLLMFHFGIIAVMGLMSGLMCRRCAVPMRYLQLSEVVIFGAPIVFFLVVEYYSCLLSCREGYFIFESGRWLLMMFIYAIFIPSTWQRAAMVTGLNGGCAVDDLVRLLFHASGICRSFIALRIDSHSVSHACFGGGQHIRRLHYRHVAARGFRGEKTGPVSAPPPNRGRRDGRSLSGRTRNDEAALRYQAYPLGQGRRSQNPGPFPARGCAPRPSSRIGTRSKFSTMGIPKTVLFIM